MSAKKSILGVVIAGGRSQRFGGEKSIALFAGRPLLLWAVDRLARLCSEVAINTRPGTGAEALARAHGLTVLNDLPGDPDGPLAGVRVALTWAQGRHIHSVAVSPCDVPGLPDDLYTRLYAAAGDGAAMAETSEGRQPLCAVWPVSALPRLTTALADGAHPPTWRMLEELNAVKVRFDPPEAFANLNTREDLAGFEAQLTSGGNPR